MVEAGRPNVQSCTIQTVNSGQNPQTTAWRMGANYMKVIGQADDVVAGPDDHIGVRGSEEVQFWGFGGYNVYMHPEWYSTTRLTRLARTLNDTGSMPM